MFDFYNLSFSMFLNFFFLLQQRQIQILEISDSKINQ